MPRHAKAWQGRGSALMGLQRFEEAVESLDRALELAPGDPQALEQRSTALRAAKDAEGYSLGRKCREGVAASVPPFSMSGNVSAKP